MGRVGAVRFVSDPSNTETTMNPRKLLCMSALFLPLACGGGGGGGSSGATAGRPTGLTAHATATGIELDWNTVPGAAQYAIYVGDVAGFAHDEQTLLGGVTGPPAMIAVNENGTYYFSVTAIVNGVESEASNEVSIVLGGGGGGGGGVGGGSGPDPLLAQQWHLDNTGQSGGTFGEDVRVKPVWNAGITGQGVDIAIVDDGLEVAHEDLAANVISGLSFDYVDGDSNPTRGAHGTCCAGVAASVGQNAFGGRGAAFGARLAGFAVLDSLTDQNQGDAMVRGLSQIEVSSNSWGAPDHTGAPTPTPTLWSQAVVQGVTQGRNGRGIVYVWAAGNGAEPQPNAPGTPTDNSNLDGQANFPAVIAIGAVGDDGKKASYSEEGANLLVCTPSQGRGGHAITTVDRTGNVGFNQGTNANDYANTSYTNTFNGTSSACPLAAGCVALMLQANPNLTWRDVRLVLARTARRNDFSDADWKLNGAGLHVNHKYGFGVIDAQAAVTMAVTFQSVGGMSTLKQFATPALAVNLPIPDNNPAGLTRTTTVSGSPVSKIEFVQVFFDSDHTFIGDLRIVLRSPSGTESVLNVPHSMTQAAGLENYTFSTMRHLDEPSNGTWTLKVSDEFATDTGTLRTWGLVVYGS